MRAFGQCRRVYDSDISNPMIGGRNLISMATAEAVLSNGGFDGVFLQWKQPKKVRPVEFKLGPDRMGTAAHRVWLRRQNEKPPIRVGWPDRKTVTIEDARETILSHPGSRKAMTNAHARFLAEIDN